MSKKKNPELEELKNLADEARESFDLLSTLQRKPKGERTRTITVYTDEVAGEEFSLKNTQLSLLRRENKDGVNDAAIADLLPEVEEAMEAVKASSLEVKLRAIPEVIAKDCRRRAKKALGIKGKVSEADSDEFIERYADEILAASLEHITLPDGRRNVGIDAEGAALLRGELPKDQFLRIDIALNELRNVSAFGEMVTEAPDFSQGI